MLRGGAMEKEEKTEKKIFLLKIDKYRKSRKTVFNPLFYS